MTLCVSLRPLRLCAFALGSFNFYFMNSTTTLKSRLYWQCRRGMLELDHLLQGFYHRSIDELSPAELKSFESLLQCPDAQLLEYLLGHSVPVDTALSNVVHKIRHAATH